MTLATGKPPLRQMTEEEAIEITDAIKGNIDSLGKMLIEMQERKGYLALGYKTLEQYAASEFGKSKSRVYQAIQEFKIEEEIVQELAAENSQIKSLKMPGTHLRMLKDLPSEKKLEAIKYANLLAEQEGRKRATKLHLQVATLKLGEQKPEHLRKSIEDMGFAKGVEVELTQGFGKGGRGVIRRFDKKGQIYVEMHKGTSVPQPWDVDQLRIVPDSEKPQIPASAHTAKIGDKVKIYSSHRLRGKTGEIVARINEKIAAVKAEGELGITEIPYAEIEVIEEVIETVTGTDWNKHSIWNEGNTTWAYNTSKREIRQLRCPEVCFQPSEIGQFNSFKNPSDWLTNWKEEYGVQLATHLLDTDQIATLVATVAIGMDYEAKKNFIHRISHLLSNEDRCNAESAVDVVCADSPATALESTETAKLLAVNADHRDETLVPEQTAEFITVNADHRDETLVPEQTAEFITVNAESVTVLESIDPDWKTALNNFDFISIGDDDLDCESIAKAGEYRGWEISTEGDTIINLHHPEKGLFSRYGAFEELDWEWMKDIINKVEDCPGQLNLFEISEFTTQASNPIEIEAIEQEGDDNWQQEWLKKHLPVRPEITYSTTQGQLREKITEKLDTLADKADALSKSLQSQRLKKADRSVKEKEIKATQKAIKDLEIFSTLQIGMLVGHTSGHINIGIVTNLTLSTGGMPEAWVKWDKDSVEVPEKISFINIKREL